MGGWAVLEDTLLYSIVDHGILQRVHFEDATELLAINEHETIKFDVRSELPFPVLDYPWSGTVKTSTIGHKFIDW